MPITLSESAKKEAQQALNNYIDSFDGKHGYVAMVTSQMSLHLVRCKYACSGGRITADTEKELPALRNQDAKLHFLDSDMGEIFTYSLAHFRPQKSATVDISIFSFT